MRDRAGGIFHVEPLHPKVAHRGGDLAGHDTALAHPGDHQLRAAVGAAIEEDEPPLRPLWNEGSV